MRAETSCSLCRRGLKQRAARRPRTRLLEPVDSQSADGEIGTRLFILYHEKRVVVFKR